jgi:murein DD-endopeptidase MepM/ murein hydrolase activator NlpD
MKLSNRFTFVIIPDANSTVRRFEVPKLVPYIAGAALLALLTVTLVLFIFHSRTEIVAEQLKDRIVSQETVYSSTVQEKDETIELLQSEVIQLSQQTAEMKVRIDDIRRLEDEVRSITGSGKAATAAVVEGADVSAAMGGINRKATDGEVTTLLTQTRSQLNLMNKDLALLKDSISDSKEKALALQEQLRITPSIWPVDSRQLTSGFGLRRDPFTFRPSFHGGYDISAPMNSEVRVTADGQVSSVGKDIDRGNYIMVDHANGLQTLYMHLNSALVNKGDLVPKGSLIGLVGSTGRSTGYHLHYEILKNGESIDPKPYLK